MADATTGSPGAERRHASLALRYRLDEEVALAAVAGYRHVERWEVAVIADGAPGDDERVEIGHARVLIFNLEAGDDIGDFADQASGTWVDNYTTCAAPGPDGDDDERPPLSHVLLLDQVWLRPDARGQGLGPIIAAAVIERLGRGCHLAACYPAPFESPHQAPEERVRSVEALGRVWSKVGFRHWYDGVWMLSLDATDRHRPLVALLRARQSGAAVPEVLR